MRQLHWASLVNCLIYFLRLTQACSLYGGNRNNRTTPNSLKAWRWHFVTSALLYYPKQITWPNAEANGWRIHFTFMWETEKSTCQRTQIERFFLKKSRTMMQSTTTTTPSEPASTIFEMNKLDLIFLGSF